MVSRKHLQRLAHASLAVLDTVLLPAVAAVATHVRTLSVAAAAAAAAQALEVGVGRCFLGKKRLEMWCEVTNFVDSFINIIQDMEMMF